MYMTALDNETWHGVYNAVAPHPVTNRELTLTLARKIRGRYFLPVHIPVFLLKIVMGEMSVEVLKSTTVSSGKIQSSGFEFTCSNISEALRQSVSDRELS
jgi:NAD dependent epimerase/dehydratase family enzyme